MIILRFLTLFASYMILDARFTLYYSDDRHQASNPIFDCIYAYLHDNHKYAGEPITRNYHLIPYCRRPDDKDEMQEETSDLNINHSQMMISFADLNKQGVTSAQLLTWMAPIDVAERYEKYDGSWHEIFYNCSSPWFGSVCQYKFGYDTPFLFRDIVSATFANRSKLCHNVEHSTCYPFLPDCYRAPSPICLDWREICDGKFDCMNGEDEQLCEQLEINECNQDEYRCHFGGQCIPLAFAGDGRTNVDCLDGTDEIDATILYDKILSNLKCNINSTFLCEERSCRHAYSFSCGDGDCILLSMLGNTLKWCSSNRHSEITRVLLTSNHNVSNIACQQALRCLIRISDNMSSSCSRLISNTFNISRCELLSTHCFSKWVAIPQQPLLFGFFQFLYDTNRSISEFETNILPNIVCFDPQRCPALLQMNVSIKLINGLTCYHIYDLITITSRPNFDNIRLAFKDVIQRCLTIGTELSCRHSSLFHCPKSLKCISYHRLVDGLKDCYYGEDEFYPACQLNDSSRFRCLSNSSICLSTVAVGNLLPNCPDTEDEMPSTDRFHLQVPPFSYLCNSKYDRIFTFGEKMFGEKRDEKYCEQWPCNTPYVRCDRTWNCLNGIDELNCPNRACLSNEHQCRLQDDSSTICLSIEYLFDEYIHECPPNQTNFYRNFYFNNRTNSNMSEYISWNKIKCITEDKICRRQSTVSYIDNEICLYQNYTWYINETNTPLTNRTVKCSAGYSVDFMQHPIQFSSTSHLGFFPPAAGRVASFRHIGMVSSRTISTVNISSSWYCHRGILVQFHSNKTSLISTTIDKCLCPPNYFGARCQWQNQRVSLTLQLLYRSSTLANIVFQVIIMLIDEDGQITSNHEQIIFAPIRDCNTKFNIYLLYPNRPKNISANYSIHIDIFRKTTLEYHGSWYLSIPFQFLPVNRLAAQILIPESFEIESCPLSCGDHGRCIQYTNKKLLYFCQCDQGYSGTLCNITHVCHCSNDSICLSSSICVCPLHKFGRQCYLKHSTCQLSNNPCKNNGLCIPNDDRISRYEVSCLCPEDYSGKTCEIHNNRIDIEFNETIIKNVSSVLFHFITLFTDKEHERTTTFKKIPFDNNTITLYVQQPFNILFTELTNQTYYLTIVRETFINSENIHTQLQSNQRCSYIGELLNNTFMNYTLLRRVKYYPMLCRQHRQLMCFYDKIYMCVCDLDRFSNCFHFNPSLKYDCKGQNVCKNNGQCFENNATCPTTTTCVCETCYYGTRCEFSTKGFILSLDPILGYYIKPNVSINRQPGIVKLSIAIITLMFASGLVSGSLSIMTFRMKKTREVGCGWYLLISASVSLCLIILLKIKFWILVLSQKAVLTNRSFLSFSCIVTDGSLKTLLATNEWLNACVAIERMLTVLKGASFNKFKSKRIAKSISIIVLLLILCTYLHDPLKRELIDDFDTDEKRTWCFIQHLPFLDTYNFVINLFHFLVPMLINFISALTIIVSTARSRSTAQSKASFMQHLKRQLKQHKHLLLTPCLLILLGSPRLIIPFFSGCMKSPREPWLFLIGYFISFIPVTLHFFIFVWPSKKYMDEFRKTVRKIKRRFRLNVTP